MNSIVTKDPLEKAVAEALLSAGVDFLHESSGDPRNLRLDFYLPELKTHIEVKGGHSERVSEQMSRSPNVIVLQGATAVRVFCELISVSTRP